MKLLAISVCLVLAGLHPARAIVFWNLDNSANLDDPGTGAPWGSVAKVIDAGNTTLSGSAIYLGNGYLLTADHVTMGTNSFSHVTFDGTNTFEIDPTFKAGTRDLGIQVASGVDLAVFRLTIEPVGVPAVSLLTSTNEVFGGGATMIGWGVGRDPSSGLESTNVTWGNAATSALRWGLNAPLDSLTINYLSYSMDALRTIAGADGVTFSPDGLGDAEGAATLYDSGSALFQKIDEVWFLIGVTTAVQNAGFSIYGDDKVAGTGRGDANYYARISTYEQDIVAVIPEPGTVSLLAAGAVASGLAALRRRRRQESRSPSGHC